jgi:hypothetical protein
VHPAPDRHGPQTQKLRPAQTGDLDPELAYRMSSLLLVIRDYIAPVEPAIGGLEDGRTGYSEGGLASSRRGQRGRDTTPGRRL